MRYRNRLAGVLVSLALIAGVSAAGVGGAGAQDAQTAAVTGWPALGHFHVAAADRPQPAPEHRVPTLGPHISGTTNTANSTNWSGYVDTGGLTNTFSGVGGEWTVPAVQPSGVLAASSQWIGIDGATNNSLIQTGTSSITQNGGTQYFAWYEILPAASIEIGVVSPTTHRGISSPSHSLTLDRPARPSGSWKTRPSRAGSHQSTRSHPWPTLVQHRSATSEPARRTWLQPE